MFRAPGGCGIDGVFREFVPRFWFNSIFLRSDPFHEIWPALRFGQRGAVSAALVMTTISVWGTARGLGPFSMGSLNESLLTLEVFLSLTTLTVLCGSAILTQKYVAENERRKVFEA